MGLIGNYCEACRQRDKRAVLDILNNVLECETPHGNLEIACSHPETGAPGKRRPWLEIRDNPRLVELVRHRSIGRAEIVLDLDPERGEEEHAFKLRIEETINELKHAGAIVLGHHDTGSRGAHLHTLMPELQDMSRHRAEQIKRAVLKKFRADPMKASQRALIACECSPHFKTGRWKVLR